MDKAKKGLVVVACALVAIGVYTLSVKNKSYAGQPYEDEEGETTEYDTSVVPANYLFPAQPEQSGQGE